MKENLYDELYTEQEEQVDYKALFFKYLIHWKWFVASIVVCLIGGWIYLHYTTPVYSITGSVIIKDNKKNNSVSTGLADLEDLGFYSSTNNFDNEVEVLHSRTLLKKVVEELDLYINYRTRENLRPVELYKDTPVKVWLTPEEAEKLPNGAAVLEVVLKPGGKLSVSTEIDEQEFKQDFDKLPALLTTPYGTFSFTPGDSAIVEKEQEITVTVAAPRIMTNGYANALSVEPTSKTTTIAQITLQNTSPQRGVDFINKLIEIYNRDANDDKNEVASDAQLALSENSEYEKKRAENSTQLRLVQFLSEYANNPDHAYEVLPVNVGLTDTGLTELINRYNEMLLERKRLLRTSSESNPVVVNLDASIRAMRSNVQTTILSVQKGLMITKADLERQAGKYAGRITSAPGQERQLVSISRQQEIKAGLYLMLLQKREENAITLASTANNARIVDEAQAGLLPVSPKGKLIYLIAFVLGIAIPVGIIYIIELLRYKIEDRSDVEKLTTVPIIGDIPASDNMPKEGSVVVHENQNDMMAETFRNVRTNVQYMLGNNQKVVLITSTTSGEGKSFVAANLAISFALLGKKVVIVGLDIRKPGLNKAFQMSHKEDGITRYLADPEHTDLMSLLQQSNVTPNLYILSGGAIPPNPTELVARDSLVQAVDRLKKEFDYVILDTAPIGMVTDTQLISRVADMSIYVCRAGYTPKAGYLFINELRDHKKLPNLCTIINDVNIKTGKYGYGTYGKYGYGRTYGYGYGYDEKSK